MRLASSKRLTMSSLVYEVINCYTRQPAQKNSKANGKKCKPGLRDGEGVWRAHEDVGKRGEEEEQDTEGECGVKREEEDDRLE
jgi:hypothetical protein